MSVLESVWRASDRVVWRRQIGFVLHEQSNVLFYGVMVFLTTKSGMVFWVPLLSHTVLARAANLLHVIASNVF